MFNESEIAQNDYLTRHLEPEKGEAEAFVIPLFKDQFTPDFDEKANTILHTDGEIAMALHYKCLDRRTIGVYQEAMKKLYKKNTEERGAWERFWTPPVIDLVGLRIYQYDRPNTAIESAVHRGKSNGISITVSPHFLENHNDPSRVDGANQEYKTIFIGGDPTKLSTVLTIYHEIGHIIPPGNESASEARRKFNIFNNNKRKKLNLEEAEEIIKEERGAWAYALVQLKPLINKENKEQVLNYIHDAALASYSNAFREKADPGWIDRFMGWVKSKIDEGKN